MLTTACSSDDDAVNNENTKKGYPLQVTVNVTRQSDGTTRATYNESTKTLGFSSGDQLFVEGSVKGGTGKFAGALTWVSGTTFSGTITTEYPYTGTADELFTAAQSSTGVSARLLPADYEDYNFFTIKISDLDFWPSVVFDLNKAFAPSKNLAVEQISNEFANGYDNGFALSPENAILSFTITGLTASTAVNVSLIGSGLMITNSVTTDSSGNATFAMGVPGVTFNYDLNNFSLTVGGKSITLTSGSKTLEAGHIYNITRSAAPAPSYTMAADAVAEDKGKLICTAGHIHAYNADAECTATRVAKIIYIGTTGHATYTHGLALALVDEGLMNWSSACTACNTTKNTNTPVTAAEWLLASKDQWDYMLGANGAGSYTALRDGFTSVGGTNLQSKEYWSSTENGSLRAWRNRFFDDGSWSYDLKSVDYYVRAALAF